jgi:dihydrofolate reductase
MRKIIVLEFMSLDGVIQAPGGPDEDRSGGFKYGGWTAHYGDEIYGSIIQKQMAPADLLLGRKTFQIFANYWPKHAEVWPGINDVHKYVLSKKLKKTDKLVSGWQNSTVIRTLADIKKLKASKGSDIKIWGSSELVQLLMKNDLVDEFWLKIFPVTLGKGKKLFGKGTIPAAFEVTESAVTPSGIIMISYKRSGKVKTGTVGD